MTRRLSLVVVLIVLSGLLFAAGAPGEVAAPGRIAVAPQTTITSHPPNLSSSPNATFRFQADDPDATFQCSIGAGFSDCSSPITYSGLPDGSYTFSVQATNAVLETGPPATDDWTIDNTPPVTTITSSTTLNTSATFHFTSEPNVAFECNKDGQGFIGCSSPKTYNGLSNGTHTFAVRATDQANNTGGAATATVTIGTDSIAPVTTITSGPASPTSATSATFTFISNESGSIFECSRNGGAFTSCTSPKTYNGFGNGTHTVAVRATDPADNTGAPASFSWTVGTDSAAPDTFINSGPIGTTSSTSATFEFTSSEIGSVFECSRNLSAFIPCSSPITYAALADGTHTFQVRAIDPSDNVDATPAVATWTVASNTGGVPTVTNLRADAGDHRVRLRWKNPTGLGIQRIEIRRGTTRVRTFFNNATRFIDTNVFNGRKYTYWVVVFDDVVQRSPATGVFAVPHGKLKAPGDGKTIRRPPVLRWLPRARATYYNVQLFRNGRKIQSQWPARSRLQLKNQWRYQGRNYTLRDGRYVWWVFPGFGKRADNRYGKAWGHSTFIKR